MAVFRFQLVFSPLSTAPITYYYLIKNNNKKINPLKELTN